MHIYDADYGYNGTGITEYSLEVALRRAKHIIFYMKDHEQLLGEYWFMKALFYSSLIAYVLLFIVDKVRLRRVPTIYLKIASGGLLLIILLLDHYHYCIPYINLGSQPYYAATS